MTIGRFLGFSLAHFYCAAALFCSRPSYAVIQFKSEVKPFSYEISNFTDILQLVVKDDIETIKMPLEIMHQRLTQSVNDETVEPITVMLGSAETQISAMAEKLAIKGKEDDLAAYIHWQITQAPKVKALPTARTIIINREAFNYIDHEALAELYAKPQHNLTIDVAALKSDPGMRRELFQEVAPFLSVPARRILQRKINKGEALSVNTDLLPEFARSMVKKFITYRGPNCFHAALAFQSPLLTSSSQINVKREVGYHRAMINYDELWRVLNQEFYEIEPEKHNLKFGDMLVLFDVPANYVRKPEGPPDFHWIRHTATYLFEGYTFSKGSKSPNTPYSVRTLEEEWNTWKHFSKNLGIKVYRRSLKAINPQPPIDQSDWIY